MLLTERLCLYASFVNLSFVTFPSSQFMFYVLCLCFIVRLMFVFLFCMSCLIYCVLCVFVLFGVSVSLCIVLFLTICVQVYGLLPPGDTPIAVNKYNHNHILYSLNTNCPLRTLIYKTG